MRVTIDFETYSDLDVTEVGSWRYAEDFSTDVLCLAWSIDGGPVYTWRPHDTGNCQGWLHHAIQTGATIDAHNAQFERAVWENIMVPLYGWPEIEPQQWDCTMARAASRALPLGLDDAGAALDLPIQKDKAGKRLLRLLAGPQKVTKKQPHRRLTPAERPEEFQALYAYCRQDVEAEDALRRRLGPLPAAERRVWLLDQRINARGVAVDMEAVEAAIDVVGRVEERLTRELISITKGAVTTHNQGARILKWLGGQGVHLDDLTAERVADAIPRTDGAPRRILELRSILAKASTKKLERFRASVCADGRVRGLLQYHGAFTGRWAGRIVQPQNFPRPKIEREHGEDWSLLIDAIKTRDVEYLDLTYGDAMMAVADALRPMLVAGPGHQLVAGDLSAIEAVGLACLAGEQRKIDVFRRGEDPYIFAARNVFGAWVKDKKTHPKERQVGKICELAFGYGGGVGAWRNFDNSDRDDEEIEGYRDAWRAGHPKVVDLWHGLEAAAIRAVANPGREFDYNGIRYVMRGEWLICLLRSGRAICYYGPQLEEGETPWGAPTSKLSYMSWKQGQWKRVTTWGGKLTENVVQAECRDVLVHGMFGAEDAGLPIVLTVHDEIVTEPRLEETSSEGLLHAAMAAHPPWATDWPLKVETWSGERYRK